MRVLAVAYAMLLMSGLASAAETGVSDTEIKIGDVNIMTGPAAFVGRGFSLGSKIAAAEINAAGGVNGRKLTVITEDDGYIPSRSFQALTKLLEVDGIFALNGTSGTANVLAMMPLITENNLPTIVTEAPAAQIYTPVRPSVFTFGASYTDAFYAQLRYIHDHVAAKDAVYGLVRQDDDFGKEVEAGFDRAVKEFGSPAPVRIRFKKGTSDFSAEMAQMKQAGVSVVANAAIFAGAANVLAEARKFDMQIAAAQVWTEDIPASSTLLAPAGYDFYVADYITLVGPASDRFKASAAKYLTPDEIATINRYTYVSYIGLQSLAEGMRRCGKDLTRACVIDKLRALHGFDVAGLSAPVSFDNPKQLSGTQVIVYQYDTKAKSLKIVEDFKQY